MNNTMNLKSKFKKYVIPSIASMWVFSLYTMVDGIFVSKGVGSEALAAINISAPFINFIFAISILFSTGAMTIISMKLGNKEYKKANEYFTLNFIVILIISAIIIAVSLLNLNRLALFLGATHLTIGYVKDFLGTVILFVGFFIASYSLEVLIKADGYPHLSTFGVIISALTNVVLDYIFVIKLGYGIQGAAFATGMARVLSFSFFFIHFLRRKGKLRFTSKFRFDFSVVKKIMSIGVPDCTTEISMAVIVLLFNQTIQRVIGEQGIVTYSVIYYVFTLVITTMMGISQGIQPISSYYFGKGDKKSVITILNMALKTVTFASIVSFLLVMIFTSPIVSLFIDRGNMQLFNYTVKSLRMFTFAFLVMGFNVVIAGFCVSVGRPGLASIVSLGRGLVVLSISLFTMVLLFGGNGIWFSTLVSELIMLVISLRVLKICKEGIIKEKEELKVA